MGSTETAVTAIPAAAMERDRPVQTLSVNTQGVHDILGVAGAYDLQDKRANGMPVWRKRGGGAERWLFSNPEAGEQSSGRWCIHGESAVAEDFVMGAAWAWLEEPHAGRMPHELTGPWMKWGADGAERSTTTVTQAPCRAVTLWVQPREGTGATVSCSSMSGKGILSFGVDDWERLTIRDVLPRITEKLQMEDVRLVRPDGRMICGEEWNSPLTELQSARPAESSSGGGCDGSAKNEEESWGPERQGHARGPRFGRLPRNIWQTLASFDLSAVPVWCADRTQPRVGRPPRAAGHLVSGLVGR